MKVSFIEDFRDKKTFLKKLRDIKCTGFFVCIQKLVIKITILLFKVVFIIY